MEEQQTQTAKYEEKLGNVCNGGILVSGEVYCKLGIRKNVDCDYYSKYESANGMHTCFKGAKNE